MRIVYILRAILREIFEEAAYERFCQRNGLNVSRGSYARFLRDTHASKVAKPRCC